MATTAGLRTEVALIDTNAVMRVITDFRPPWTSAPAETPGVAHPLAPTDLRLVVVVRGTESYGTGTKIVSLLESLVERGAAIRLYVLGDGHMAEALSSSLLSITTDPSVPPRFQANRSRRFMGFTRTMLASVPFMLRLTKFLRRTPCDAIIFCEHGLVLQLGLVARLARTRAFWMMANAIGAGYPFDLNRHMYAFAFRHLAMNPVANSEYTRQSLGQSAHYAAKIDLGINPGRVCASPVTPPVKTEKDPSRISLLIMSRLVQSKGHLLLLQAILSSPAFDEIDLVICGGPIGTPYTEALLREAAAHGASHRLRLLGPVTDVAHFYEIADIVVNARLDPEPFGLSIVEAMLAGKPVLAHASGGPADIVVDGVTGWHMAEPTVAAFATGLRRMLADRAIWPEIGRAAMARAQSNYTHHAMTEQLLDIISKRHQSPTLN